MSVAQRSPGGVDGSAPLRRQFGRFLLVGGSATALHYAILILLHRLLGIEAVLASSVGFVLSAVYNFLASYYFTFRSTLSLACAGWRYALAGGAGFLLNAGCFWLVYEQSGAHYLAAQGVATAVGILWSFGTGRAWAFAAAREAPRQTA